MKVWIEMPDIYIHISAGLRRGSTVVPKGLVDGPRCISQRIDILESYCNQRHHAELVTSTIFSQDLGRAIPHAHR